MSVNFSQNNFRARFYFAAVVMGHPVMSKLWQLLFRSTVTGNQNIVASCTRDIANYLNASRCNKSIFSLLLQNISCQYWSVLLCLYNALRFCLQKSYLCCNSEYNHILLRVHTCKKQLLKTYPDLEFDAIKNGGIEEEEKQTLFGHFTLFLKNVWVVHKHDIICASCVRLKAVCLMAAWLGSFL